MKSVGVLAILMAVSVGYAQIPDTLWTKTYGGSEDDWASAVVQTSDGGYIIAGTTCSFGSGNENVWLLKTDANGDTIWTWRYGDTLRACANDVQQTSDGGYIVVGSICELGPSEPDEAFYMIKTNSLGEMDWSVMADWSRYGRSLNSVKQTSDNCYIVAGCAGGGRYSRAVLRKADSLGNFMWDSSYYHGGHGSCARSILQTTDGGYVAAGLRTNCFDTFKTDSLGGLLWYNIYSEGVANSVQQVSDGGFILAGHAGDEGNGEADLCLVWCDSAGNSLGISEYGGPADDVANSIDMTTDDCYIVAGYTESFGTGNSDVYLLKIDGYVYGNTLWWETYGGAADDVGNSVQRTADGGYIIAGYTESFGAGGRDVYLIKTASEVGIEEQPTAKSVDKEKLITTTIFRGPLRLPEGKNCKVYDTMGRVMDCDGIQPGVYFIEVEGVVTEKVVKIR
jgi:hypothetical protein